LNSKIVFQSHIDMSNNSLLHVETIYFSDGTSLSTGNMPTTTIPTTTPLSSMTIQIIHELQQQIEILQKRIQLLEKSILTNPNPNTVPY
jgi:hypothetical protein